MNRDWNFLLSMEGVRRLSTWSSAMLLLASSAAPAPAQTVTLPSGSAPGQAVGYGPVNGAYTAVDATHPLPVAGLQQAVPLVAANAPTAGATAFGGKYVFAQACATYGTVTLRYRGPDGATMTTLLSKTTADAGGGTLISLGTNAVVDATVNGTTGCNASLSRVP
jgi:hypothetical protein